MWSDRKESKNEQQKPINNVVIVGGGPIGLAHAWALKMMNPQLNITVLEKYEKYQRSHNLIMQAKQLEALLNATNTTQDPVLSKLLTRIKEDPHIRTNELEDVFKKLAEEKSVKIETTEVKEDSIEKQLAEHKPDLIIGADGTHSVVNRCLFPKDNQVKIKFDYVLQLRFEIAGEYKAEKISTGSFLQLMARYGRIANEYVGHYDADTKKTPVTMQMMISAEAFERLKKATSKNPIFPFAEKKESKDSKETKDQSPQELSMSDIDSEIKGFLDSYLRQKINTPYASIDQNSIRVSVNEAPATYAKQPICLTKDNIPVILVGDAVLGLSYFKGLNAGLESTAKLCSLLNPLITQSQFNQEKVKEALANYAAWFLNEFAPKKVKEVEQYSSLQIRTPMKIMTGMRSIKESSFEEDLNGDLEIITDYFKLLGTQPEPLKELKNQFYPHRSHDLVRFGQFDYIPITHTLGKTAKIFVDYVEPYKPGQLKQDFKQPLVGLANVTVGAGKILVGFFTLNPKRFADGIVSTLRGGVELATTPLTWIIKPITRGISTWVAGKPKIEQNKGIRRIAKMGTQLLEEKKDEKPYITNYKRVAVVNDLHRKFNKSFKRGQQSEISELVEVAAFAKAHEAAFTGSANTKPIRDYFSLFGAQTKIVSDMPKESKRSSLTA